MKTAYIIIYCQRDVLIRHMNLSGARIAKNATQFFALRKNKALEQMTIGSALTEKGNDTLTK